MANFAYREDTFTVPGAGVVLNVDGQLCLSGGYVYVAQWPLKYFALEVRGTGGTPTLWSVQLLGSVNGINYTTLLTHATATGLGVTLFSVASPCRFMKSNVVTLTLGPATNIIVSVLGLD